MKVGVQELLVILLIVIVIFGPTQIPKLTKMFGQSIRNFREGMGEAPDKNDGGSHSGDAQA